MDTVVLTTVLPSARRTGGEVVTDAFVRAMRDAGHLVTVVGYARPGERPPHDPDAIEVGTRPIETAGAPRSLLARWAMAAVLRRLPYSVAKYRSRAFQGAARAGIARAGVVVIDHAQAGWAVDDVPASTPVILLAHNVEHRLYAEQADSTGGARRWINRREERLMRALERRLVERAAAVWALTTDDAAALEQLAPATPVHAFEVPGQPAAPAERTIDVALLGTWSWAANAEGLRWFCDEVVPNLPRSCRVEVAGAGGEWSAATPGVTYRGRVPDAGAFLASARVVAVPSTAGSGVQVKTLDALASGAWVVATPVAVRGIDGAGSVATVTDDGADFAAAITRLMDDDRTLGPCDAALAWSEPRRRHFRAAVASALSSIRAPST